MRHTLQITVVALMVAALVSCQNDNYLASIPGNATALLAIDAEQAGIDLGTEAIDTKQKVYLFETADGLLGMAAKCKESGEGFRMLRDQWACGYAAGKMLVVGPVLPAQQAETRRQVERLLKQDEEESIVGTPLLRQLDSIQGPMALVAQAAALPEQVVAPFTLGAPKDADPSQVCIAARMTLKDGVLRVDGSTFSFNKRINAALKSASGLFRPLKGDFEKEAESHLFSLLMNVDGTLLLPAMQQNRGLQALLAGMNTAIDMDNILRSVDGDMALMLDGDMNLEIRAQLASCDFLKDIGYWKSSCPQGTRILDQGQDTWLFEGGEASFCFGVTASNQFFGQLTHREKPSASAAVSSALGLLEPFVGELKAVVYTIGNNR